MAGARQGASEFLTPMCNISRRAVTIDHAHGNGAGVGELMKDARRNVNGLAGCDGATLSAETHFAGAFQDEIDFFLILIVPGDLTAVRLQSDMAESEVGCLNGAYATHEILSFAAGRILPAGDFRQVGDDHCCLLQKVR